MVKEPHPTLVIGLGGTGQWVACHVLKELLELYGLQKPEDLSPRVQILAIDTDFKNVAKVGFAGDVSVATGARIGQVTLPQNMRISIGENVHDYVKKVSENPREYEHVASWLNADWFLGQTNRDTLLNLVDGAGAFRPLGRLAVFYNLTQSDAALRTGLTNAIERIRVACSGDDAGRGLQSLTVCIAGSLCGGTGAGLFVDVAYLVKKLAGGTPVNARGYLVLPQAFDATVPPDEASRRSFRRRAFAAMRELRRFARELDYRVGYPMYYAGPALAKDEVLRGHLNKTLFELLYYFDGTLTRPGVFRRSDGREEIREEPATVEEGVAALIAEAILMWIDGETSTQVLSHGANLTEKKTTRIAERKLDVNAAVAGGVGAYTLQLPLYHIVEGWAHELGREVLREFLGVAEEDGTSKIASRLREDWAGGENGQPGTSAARQAWAGGKVGNVALSRLAMDHLESGNALRVGGAVASKRKDDLKARSLAEWERLLEPETGPTTEDQETQTEFFYPQRVVLETGGPFRRPKQVRLAMVQTSATVGGAETRNPSIGAERVAREVDEKLDLHLGAINPQTNGRGGSDASPEGAYPRMLRRWAESQVAQFRAALQSWVLQILNGVPESDRTPGETAETGRRNRAGKLGYLLALLTELSMMLDETTIALREVESLRLGEAVRQRNAETLQKLRREMSKSHRKQADYLAQQQKVLEAERTYAAARAARWAAGEMHAFVARALKEAQAWREALAGDLYRSVWQGQEHVATNRAELRKLGAVREMLDMPEIERERHDFYAVGAQGAILNDLRWKVAVIERYAPDTERREPTMEIRLTLAGQELPLRGAAKNTQTFLDRCRKVFEKAWDNETVLGWLVKYYDGSSPERSIPHLAGTLVGKGRPPLRQMAGADPYKVGYVRYHAKNDIESGWVDHLKRQLVNQAGQDPRLSQSVPSSDPYRLTFLAFEELVDVEKLEAYREGRDGTGGVGGYTSLPAATDPAGGMSRQVLHVFPAEHNASKYEERLGELLPDKVVSLLENEDRFRLFVLAWAYGEEAGNKDVLLHSHRIPDDAKRYPGKWVRRLTTGPFPGEIDLITRLPKPAEHRWLTEPTDDLPALFKAAETFLLGGEDSWQAERGLAIDEERVRREVERCQEEMAQRVEVGLNTPQLRAIVEGLPETSEEDKKAKARARLRLADYEHLQRLSVRIRDELIPWAQGVAQKAREKAHSSLPRIGAGSDEIKSAVEQRAMAADQELDIALFKVMLLFIGDELRSREREIVGRQGKIGIDRPY